MTLSSFKLLIRYFDTKSVTESGFETTTLVERRVQVMSKLPKRFTFISTQARDAKHDLMVGSLYIICAIAKLIVITM